MGCYGQGRNVILVRATCPFLVFSSFLPSFYLASTLLRFNLSLVPARLNISVLTTPFIFLSPPSPSPSPPLDPVIHSNSQIARQQMFGRTDLGKKGMHKFFRTHVCNDVCRLLKLPGSRSPEAKAAEKAANSNAGAREWGGRGAKSRRMYNP